MQSKKEHLEVMAVIIVSTTTMEIFWCVVDACYETTYLFHSNPVFQYVAYFHCRHHLTNLPLHSVILQATFKVC